MVKRNELLPRESEFNKKNGMGGDSETEDEEEYYIEEDLNDANVGGGHEDQQKQGYIG